MNEDMVQKLCDAAQHLYWTEMQADDLRRIVRTGVEALTPEQFDQYLVEMEIWLIGRDRMDGLSR